MGFYLGDISWYCHFCVRFKVGTIEMFLQKSMRKIRLFFGGVLRFRFRMGKKFMGFFFVVEPKWSEKKPKSCLQSEGEKSPSSYSSLAAVYIYIFNCCLILQQYYADI